jgi:hypothetical protein
MIRPVILAVFPAATGANLPFLEVRQNGNHTSREWMDFRQTTLADAVTFADFVPTSAASLQLVFFSTLSADLTFFMPQLSFPALVTMFSLVSKAPMQCQI